MGCIYLGYNENCTLYEKDIENLGQEDGLCICDEDPDPSDTCEMYESDGNKGIVKRRK